MASGAWNTEITELAQNFFSQIAGVVLMEGKIRRASSPQDFFGELEFPATIRADAVRADVWPCRYDPY